MNVGNGLSLGLGKYQKLVNIRLKEMKDQHFVRRLWNKEEDLWMKKYIPSEIPHLSMGWLNVAEKMLANLPMIEKFYKDIQHSGINHVVLLGMGGSSLTPLVFQKTFSKNNSGFAEQTNANNIQLLVLDTTDAASVKKIENEITISKTLFVVSSKSGTTAEVMAFYNYFYERVAALKGELAGENFIAITDEGSPLVELASRKKFRNTFINFTDIGGRYSALSYFGILPAALMGVNVKELLERAMIMIQACGPDVPATQNPGVILGAAIAELASQGCDKLTYLLPAELSSFGLWLEQLLAESTGKKAKGILPLNGFPLIEKDSYGNDRVFFQLKLSGQTENIVSFKLNDLAALEHPLITIQINDELDLGQEFFRWEIATATAGSILGINPFNQPNVQESKKCTDLLLKMLEQNGKVPDMEPTLIEDDVTYYYTPHKEENNFGARPSNYSQGAKSIMENLLQLIKPGAFISLQAYLPEESEVTSSLIEIQQFLQTNFHVAVTNEFGPRYLHSTGQYHKGGPNTGIFIQFINTASLDTLIPEYSYTFDQLKKAQAIGDMQALLKNKRKVILVDLGKDYITGLNSFKKLIENIQPEQLMPATKIEKFEIPSFILEGTDYENRNIAGMTGS